MEPMPGTDAPFDNRNFAALADLVLRQDQYPLRPAAMRILAEKAQTEPEQLALLGDALRDGEPSTRRRAAQTLGCCGEAARSCLPNLCHTLRTDPMWTVRESATHAVRSICWPASERYDSVEIPLQLLDCALSDREPLVREAAIQGLIACFSDAHVLAGVRSKVRDGLGEAMNHPHVSRRCRAISAICRLPDAEYWVGLKTLQGLVDSHWKVRRTTAEQLRENLQVVFSIPERAFILPELIKRMFDQHAVVQTAARETVGRLSISCEDKSTARILERLTSKPSAAETLLLMVESYELSPEADSCFGELCERRRNWHFQNLPRPIAGTFTTTTALEDVVRRLMALAAKWQASPKQFGDARQAAEEKEAAWLLARWLEIFFEGSDEPERNG